MLPPPRPVPMPLSNDAFMQPKLSDSSRNFPSQQTPVIVQALPIASDHAGDSFLQQTLVIAPAINMVPEQAN